LGKSRQFAIDFATMGQSRKKVESDRQGQDFVDAARALECDESEERFDAALRKVAAHKPPDKKSDHKQEKEKPAK
jgi:hypothetical protein